MPRRSRAGYATVVACLAVLHLALPDPPRPLWWAIGLGGAAASGGRDPRRPADAGALPLSSPTCSPPLARHGLPAQALPLEITERMLAGEDAQIVAALAARRTLGVSLALDDLCTGDSAPATSGASRSTSSRSTVRSSAASTAPATSWGRTGAAAIPAQPGPRRGADLLG